MPKPFENAIFANDVYNIIPGSLPTGWVAYNNSNQTGFAASSEEPQYFARTYLNQASSQYIIAFRGGTEWTDIISDIELFYSSGLTLFTSKVIGYIDSVIADLTASGASLVGFAGHSLGGALSTLASSKYQVPANVFELPSPAGYFSALINNGTLTQIGIDYMKANLAIYNPTPDQINTMGTPIMQVTRLYPPLDRTLSAEFSIPPTATDFEIFTAQQFNMSALLREFNPITGLPKISSQEIWPGPGSSYSGEANFGSYAQNPFMMQQVLEANWDREESFVDYLEDKLPQLTPQLAPKSGKNLTGDNSGSSFWGGTDYSDNYSGGTGDDTYFLFGGNDTVMDIGGNNIYRLISPQVGKKLIYDANPQSAQIYYDDALIGGSCMPVTSYGTPIQNRFLEEYLRGSYKASLGRSLQTAPSYCALVDTNNGQAFLAYYKNSTLEVSNFLSSIQVGDTISLPNYQAGDFGVLPATGAVNLGNPFSFTVSSFKGTYLSSVGQLQAITSGGQSSGSSYWLINSDGSSLRYSLPFSASNLRGITANNQAVVVESSTNLYTYNLNGQLSCSIPFSYSPVLPLQTPGDNILFVGNISGIYPGNVISLYSITPNCALTSKLIPDFPYRYTQIEYVNFGGSSLALTACTTSTSFGCPYPLKILFYNQNSLNLLNQYQLPFSVGCSNQFIGTGNPGDLGAGGQMIFINHAKTASGQCIPYLYIIDASSGEASSQVLSNLIGRPAAKWLTADQFVVCGLSSQGGNLIFQLYDSSGNLLSSLNAPYIVAGDIIALSSTEGDNMLFVAASSSTSYNTNYVSIPYTIKGGDVILGQSVASLMDCSNSSAPTCYAIAQEGDGDILKASLGQNAKLFGSSMGKKTFSLVPSIEDGDQVEDANNSPTIFGMKEGDEIDLSALVWSDILVDNDGNVSWLNIPGYPATQVMHMDGGAPFNLSMNGGRVIPVMPSPFPSANPSAMPFVSPSSSPYAFPSGLPSPIPPAANADGGPANLTAGAAAGVALSAIAGATILGYGAWWLYKQAKKWWGSSDSSVKDWSVSHSVRGDGQATVVKNPLKATNHSEHPLDDHHGTSSLELAGITQVIDHHGDVHA